MYQDGWDRYHSYKGEIGKIADNLLHRDFYANKPFEKLTADITELKIGDEKIYLSSILNMYNHEIISYSIFTSPNLRQIRDMLNGLFEKLPDDAQVIFYSDQGWQYHTLNTKGCLPSIALRKVCAEKGTV